MKIVALLRLYLNFADSERAASQLITFYASGIDTSIANESDGANDHSFVPPCLVTLSDFWLDRSAEVQATAKVLFGAYLAAMPDPAIRQLVDEWSPLRPFLFSLVGYRAH